MPSAALRHSVYNHVGLSRFAVPAYGDWISSFLKRASLSDSTLNDWKAFCSVKRQHRLLWKGSPGKKEQRFSGRNIPVHLPLKAFLKEWFSRARCLRSWRSPWKFGIEDFLENHPALAAVRANPGINPRVFNMPSSSHWCCRIIGSHFSHV